MDLLIKWKALKCLENNIVENLWNPGLGRKFLDLTLKSQSFKRKAYKLNIIKIKIYCSVKAI